MHSRRADREISVSFRRNLGRARLLGAVSRARIAGRAFRAYRDDKFKVAATMQRKREMPSACIVHKYRRVKYSASIWHVIST